MRSSRPSLSILLFLGTFFNSAAPNSISNLVESVDPIEEGIDNYVITEFTPKAFIKSNSYMLNYTSCFQFRYELPIKRATLQAYTCHLSPGGGCTLDRFTHKDKEGCYALRPWKYHPDEFGFWFRLERRERNYGKRNTNRPARKTNRARRVRDSTEVLGRVVLEGIRPCSETCTKGVSRYSITLN
ncbi:unnamed protein product, partial [Mesorhabditis spiculigera]